MRLPESIRTPLDELLEERGLGRSRSVDPVGGGCITETARLRTTDDRSFFLKWTESDEHPAGLFHAEAASLNAIAATKTVRVPEVLDIRDTDHTGDGQSRWLLLEWLEPGAITAHSWTSLGLGLVALHRHGDVAFGWPRDNFIGTLPQSNDAGTAWPEFWRDRRLLPQLDYAVRTGLLGDADRARFDPLLERLDDILAPASADGVSLLHGDLWSGNVHVTMSGDAALVDPSSYYGHREVDLAMSQLFGGFDYLFYAAYEEAWPLHPEYERLRRPVYQLYYLLVHVNLFGSGYRARTLAALSSIGF